jgi:hypothetical protein
MQQLRAPIEESETCFCTQADNTVKDLKNAHIARLCIALTCCGYFRSTSTQYLRVGHTHEDVGTRRDEQFVDA